MRIETHRKAPTEETVNRSLPLQQLCCVSLAAVLNLCVSDEDLAGLGLPVDADADDLLESMRARAYLGRACIDHACIARRVGDVLDLHFVSTITHVRSMTVEDIGSILELWRNDPRGEAVPALLWSLCSDEREDVRRLGMRLAHEATLLASRRLVEA